MSPSSVWTLEFGACYTAGSSAFLLDNQSEFGHGLICSDLSLFSGLKSTSGGGGIGKVMVAEQDTMLAIHHLTVLDSLMFPTPALIVANVI